jgi:hypothetical protein
MLLAARPSQVPKPVRHAASSLGCDSRRCPPDRDPQERQPHLELVSGGHLNAPPLPSVDPDLLTCGVRVLTVFPSPPLLKRPLTSRFGNRRGVGGRGKGLDRSSGDRVYRTSLSVFASRDTGRVFRPPSGRPDNLQPPSSRRRGVRASTTSSSVNPALQLSCESDPLNRGRLVDAVARGQPVWWRRNSAPLLEADGVDREPARCRPPRQPAPRCPRSRVARHMARCHRSSPHRASRS